MWSKRTAGKWLLYLGMVGGAVSFFTGLIGCLWKESVIKYVGIGGLAAGFVLLFVWGGEQVLEAFFGNGRQDFLRADIRQHTKRRLMEAARSFEVLSGVFDCVGGEKEEGFREFAVTLPEVVCTGCRRCDECWGERIEESCAAAYEMYEAAISGRVPETEEVEYRFGGCVRPDKMKEEYTVLPLRERAEQIVRRRAREGRMAVATQMQVVSDMLKEYSDELYETTLGDGQIEEELSERLRKVGIYAQQIVVMKRKGRGLRIRMDAHCKGGQAVPVRRAAQCLGMVFGCPMAAVGESERFIGEHTGEFTFEEEPGYFVLTGVARAAQKEEKISGDSFSFLYPESGEIILLLSDGMGSGEAASKDSEAVVGLLERLLCAGFEEKTAVRLLNSVLLLRTEGKSCSTADISVINPYAGTCEFVKLGASGTYIKRENWMESIASETLPMGILSEADYDTKEKKLYDGDYVIMMSDGVPEALGERVHEVIFAAGQKKTDKTPQGVAGEILKAALEACDYKPKDDMTILVAEIVKKQMPYYLQGLSEGRQKKA